jgi:hypothetical protein
MGSFDIKKTFHNFPIAFDIDHLIWLKTIKNLLYVFLRSKTICFKFTKEKTKNLLNNKIHNKKVKCY